MNAITHNTKQGYGQMTSKQLHQNKRKLIKQKFDGVSWIKDLTWNLSSDMSESVEQRQKISLKLVIWLLSQVHSRNRTEAYHEDMLTERSGVC